MSTHYTRPTVLIILDGWGHRAESEANAIALAHKPNWDKLLQQYPHTLIGGSGRCVGLPDGQMGNSEVGHLNMGAGRIVHQDLTRIDHEIATGEFFQNKVLQQGLLQAKTNGKAVHIMGLLSPGGVHSHENHILAMIDFAAREDVHQIYLHLFLDGRDTPPRSAMASILSVEAECAKKGCGQIASIIGRYYAMDRDLRWDRIEAAYDLLTQAKNCFHAASASQALEFAYARGESDEFVQATAIHAGGVPPVTVEDGDIVIFMNFRADRAREITQAFIDTDFNGFIRKKWPQLSQYICLTEYNNRFVAPIAYPQLTLHHLFGEVLSDANLKQLRIAETEKYAHVTFFFNGGVEKPYVNEDRILIPSPAVATYDLQPEMSAVLLTDRLIEEIKRNYYDVIICNFANADMVGHSGNLQATIKAIECIDVCLGRIIETLQAVDGEAVITADHGNAEQMFDPLTNQPHTAHTCDPVPFVYVGRNATIAKSMSASSDNLAELSGKLSDIAPTLLYLMGLEIPIEMTGNSLIKLEV